MWTLCTVPAGSDRGPLYMEQALCALHAANHSHEAMTLGFGRSMGQVGILYSAPPQLRTAMETQLAAAYPDCSLLRANDIGLHVRAGEMVWSQELRLAPELFPIRRHPQFEDGLNWTVADPLASILAAVGGAKEKGVRSFVLLVVRPASHARSRTSHRALHALASPFLQRHPGRARFLKWLVSSRYRIARLAGAYLAWRWRHHGPAPPALATTSPRSHDREADLQAAADKLGRHLFEVRLHVLAVAPVADRDTARRRVREIVGAFGPFSVPRLATFRTLRLRCSERLPQSLRGRGFLLSAQELATLWHPATQAVRAPTMAAVESREREPPVGVPLVGAHPDLAALGLLRFRRRSEAFGIAPDDRRRHMAVIGKTGMGKSTLFLNLLLSDIVAGRGAGLIDPHGDLAETLLGSIPPHRTNDVVLFDAGDRQFPVAFNPLACERPDDRPLVASGVLSAFKKLYGDSWGPRLEHIFRNALLAALEVDRPSLLCVQRLLIDAPYRQRVVARLRDPIVASFWREEFGRWNERFRSEAVAPLQNKLGHFLSQPLVRAIVGQDHNALDLRSIMDGGKILIANLSKGRIGDDASALLGALLVAGLQLAAMGRAGVPERRRRDFYVYVDEFQNFATEAFPTILSEARKYGLALTIANQYLAQMDEGTRSAVYGNVGSLLVFQVGAEDAEFLAQQLGGDLTPQDVLALPRYRAYARLLIAGQPSKPFSFETLAPPPRYDGRRAQVIRHTSRHRYAQPATGVHDTIARHVAGTR